MLAFVKVETIISTYQAMGYLWGMEKNMKQAIYTHFEWVFKPKDRTTLVINIVLLCMLIAIPVLECSKRTYKVKIEFCYGREPVIAEVRTLFYPSNREISTNREAMPRYEGYVNVCNVTVIEELSK